MIFLLATLFLVLMASLLRFLVNLRFSKTGSYTELRPMMERPWLWMGSTCGRLGLTASEATGWTTRQKTSGFDKTAGWFAACQMVLCKRSSSKIKRKSVFLCCHQFSLWSMSHSFLQLTHTFLACGWVMGVDHLPSLRAMTMTRRTCEPNLKSEVTPQPIRQHGLRLAFLTFKSNLKRSGFSKTNTSHANTLKPLLFSDESF